MGTLGKNQIFEIKNEDGTSFHNLVLHKSTVESIVMSLGDKISGYVYYKNNTLSVSMHEYIVYNGVKYMLVTPPTIIREGIVSDNSELRGMTKYSFVFYHPMYVLANFPFCDVAVTSDEERYLGESKKFSWIGYPNDYIAKLNKNLDGTEWIVEKSSRFPQDKDSELSPVIPFENATIADALKTWYDTWGLPYIVDVVSPTEPAYAQGKRFKVVMGMASNEVYENESARRSGTPFVFRMGQGVGLKNNSRTPRNNKIVTRISGCGSENNIPYGYPQIRWYGASDRAFTYGDHAGVYNNVTIGGHTFSKVVSYPIYKGILGGDYVELINHPFTRKNLMPSVYRTCLFNKVSFLNTDGTPNLDYDPDIELVDYYDAIYSSEYPYPHPINVQSPSYESHTFEDIKPELGEAEIVSATPLNNDLTPAESWDDTIDNDGNYIQSYFKMVLPVLSFDLYACAAVTEEMQINMRGGSCLGCTFTVQVDWDDYKRNFYDEDGNFAPDGEQRDLSRYPKSNLGQIEVVLQKEDSTFGTIMPNMYQYPVAGDDFVILGISLPDTYITTSERELDDAMKSYMLENNEHYFDYPLKFDEAFLSTHEHILSQIRPNTIIRFEYAGETLALSVKQLSVKFGESPLPKYDITLTDNVEVVLNQIGKVADDVEKLSTLIAILRQEYNRNVWSELAKKLSKTQDDTAQGFITFLKGLQVGNQFVSGLLGEGGVFRKDADGKVYIEADKLYVRMKAYFDNVEIKDYEHTSGNRIASKAGLKCVKVEAYNANDVLLATNPQTEPIGTSYYRLYFRAKDGEDSINNDFVIGDQAFCDKTTFDNNIISHHRYWRLVVGKNGNLSDTDEFGFIDLSATDKESGSDVPQAGDDVSQLGNRTNTERQGAIIEFVGGDNAPAYQIYQGINTYSLSGKCMIDMGFDSQTGLARMNVAGNFRFGSPLNTGSYIKYDSQANQGQGELKIKAHVEFTNSDAELDALVQEHQTTYDDSAVWSEMDNLQDQIDGAIESWFLTGVPTLQNAPANTWTTDAEKNNHIGDLYYDKATGHGYRFMFDNEEEVYLWTPIADEDIARALRNAAKAQETADGKRTVYSAWNAWVKDNVNTLEVGDLFIPAANTTQGGVTYKANKVYKCITKGSAVFQAADYVDDAQAQAKVDAFVSGTYATDKQNLQSQIDGKAETYRQATDPALSWTDADKPKHVGDLWMDISSDGGKKTKIYEDKGASASPRYKWEEQDVPDAVFDEIDGKSTIYGNAIATPPTNYKKDDMWLLPADATINGVDYKAGDVLSASQDSATYSATHWSKRVRYTDDTKADSILNDKYYIKLTGGTYDTGISEAKSAAAAAQSTANTARDNADAANTRLTTWADDTKISPTEKLALKNQKADVMKEYAQIITDAAKYTGVSTTAFTTAYNKAITAFNYYTASTPENIAIITDSQTDSDATPRYSRIADYYAARQTILEAITTAAKNYATTQGNKFLDDAVYRAISAALGSNTDIVGGLVLTSLIGMRDSSEQVWGGISGQYDATAYGYGIAAWYGGAMVDKEVTPSASNHAKSLFRMDGSGYLAGGNITWDATGRVTIKDLHTDDGGTPTDVLQEMSAFREMFDLSVWSSATRIKPLQNFEHLKITRPSGYTIADNDVLTRNESDARYMLIDRFLELFDVYNGSTNYSATFKTSGLPTDRTNISIKAKFDFWSQGGITALGQGSQGGGGGQGDVTWALLANNSDTRPIALSHLTGALTDYATQSWVSTNFALKSDIPTLATLSWSGYSSGSYNGSEAKTISIPNNTNQLTNGAGFVTSSGVTSVATGTGLTGGTITSTGTISINSTYQTYISNGNTAYGWGNHANAGYITSSGSCAKASEALYLLTNNTSQAADDCYDEHAGLRFWRYNGTSSTIGQTGGDGWILSWSWGEGSVGGQIYLDDNPSKTICIRGRNNDSAKTFTTWSTVLHTGNSSVSKSGETLTVNIGGTSQSLTNTWRGIQDNLSSSSTTDSLSAYQGYLLANGSARDNTKLPLAGGEMTGMLRVNHFIFGYNYGHAGGNAPSFVFDKAGSYFTGIGANGEADTIYFSAATISDGEASWVTSYKQKWKFNGTIYQEDNAVIHAGNIGSQSVSYANSAGSVSWSNVTGKPINFKAYSGSLSSGGWAALQGMGDAPSIAISYNNSSASWNSGNYSATLVYGNNDTRGMLDCAYNTPVVSFGGGWYSGATKDSPTWYMKIVGTNATTYNLDSMPYAVSAGNADTLDGYHYNGLPYLPVASVYEEQNDANPNWVRSYAINHRQSFVYNTNGREWAYWIGMRSSDTSYGTILRLSHDGLVEFMYKGGGGDNDNWSDWKAIITQNNIGSQSVNYATTAGSAPASDVYAWAKAATKPSYTLTEISDGELGSKSKYYHRSSRGAIHHELYGSDADYGVVKITHTSDDGSGGPGAFTASLGIYDERANNLSGNYQPTFYINRIGATRTPDLMGCDVGGTRVFTIDSLGNVSIGTTSPSYKLDVNGTVHSSNVYSDGYGLFGGSSGVYIGATYAGGSSGFDCIERAGSGNTLYMQYYHTGGISMCNGGGNVMIGSGSPNYKLHVVGTFYASGLATFGGDVLPASNLAQNFGSDSYRWEYIFGKYIMAKGDAPAVYVSNESGNWMALHWASDANRGLYDNSFGWVLAYNGTNTYMSGGNVGIGTSSPSYKLHVAGDIYATGGVTSLSDARHKTIMGDTKLRVEQIADMPAITYKWNDRRDNDLHVGSIAQNWQRILPEVVSVANDLEGTLSINYGVAAMIASIVTAKKVVDHEARIKALESECERLREENKQLRFKIA